MINSRQKLWVRCQRALRWLEGLNPKDPLYQEYLKSAPIITAAAASLEPDAVVKVLARMDDLAEKCGGKPAPWTDLITALREVGYPPVALSH